MEAWQALISARQWGLVRSIGVCNFLPEHIERLIKETGVTPSVDQVELHPLFAQQKQLEWDRAHGILTESWSPLGRKSAELFGSSTLQSIARARGKTVPQIILRWHVQRGALPIPKSASPERQRENLALFDFELSRQDMDAITALSRPDGRYNNQDPAVYEEF